MDDQDMQPILLRVSRKIFPEDLLSSGESACSWVVANGLRVDAARIAKLLRPAT